MKAGLARIDITPSRAVWMDGMIRAASTGVDDPIYAKALALSSGSRPGDSVVIASLDVCSLSMKDCQEIRASASRQTGIPIDRIILAATHRERKTDYGS